MIRPYSLILLSVFLFGCSEQPPVSFNGIDVVLKPDDPPTFERIYRSTIVTATRNVEMEIKAKTYFGRRTFHGELTQENGRWILFDPERPADKIIDRELIPAVQTKCGEILRADGAFISSKPDRYDDTGGDTWVRQRP